MTATMTNHLSLCKPHFAAKIVGGHTTSDLPSLFSMKDPFFEAVALRLTAALRDAGFATSAALADKLNLTESRVRNWTNGTAVPMARDAILLADMTGTTLDWIYTGSVAGLEEGKRIRLVAAMSGATAPAVAQETGEPTKGRGRLARAGEKLAPASRQYARTRASEKNAT